MPHTLPARRISVQNIDEEREGEYGADGAGWRGHAVASAPVDAGSAVYVDAWDRFAPPTVVTVRRSRGGARLLREAAQTLVLAFVIFFGTHAAVQGYEVEGPSMQPTYHTGQRVFVNKALYTRAEKLGRFIPFLKSGDGRFLFREPRRGNVIVFSPPFPSKDDLIKRVIGEPGDRVVVKDGKVFVNGSQLDEPYLRNVQTFCAGSNCDVTLGPDQYYVMGDNRPNSSDSRIWGPVPGGKVVGKTWLISYPFGEFGWAP